METKNQREASKEAYPKKRPPTKEQAEEMMRTGLRIKSRLGVHPDVRKSFVRFAKWLRKRYSFPTMCVVYLLPQDRVLSRNGETVFSVFFEPFSRNDEPYIKIATGEYQALCDEMGSRDDAIATILGSLAFQLQWYLSWVSCQDDLDDDGAHRAASRLVDDYAETVEVP